LFEDLLRGLYDVHPNMRADLLTCYAVCRSITARSEAASASRACLARANSSIMPKLSRWTLAQSRVIARGKRIRDVRRLVVRYGGSESTWMKKSSPAFRSAVSTSSIIGMSILESARLS
jgi:hypothetical protein